MFDVIGSVGYESASWPRTGRLGCDLSTIAIHDEQQVRTPLPLNILPAVYAVANYMSDNAFPSFTSLSILKRLAGNIDSSSRARIHGANANFIALLALDKLIAKGSTRRLCKRCTLTLVHGVIGRAIAAVNPWKIRTGTSSVCAVASQIATSAAKEGVSVCTSRD
jgi:hypothetical protein